MRFVKKSRSEQKCYGCNKYIKKGKSYYSTYRSWKGTRFKAYFHNKKCKDIKIASRV